MSIVQAQNLTKRYGKTEALRSVSFSVEQGEIFGIIGADGAGKTTLFRLLTTLLLPDKGAASVDGWDCVKDFRKIRTLVGYMPGRFSLYQDLTVEENLSFFASVFGTTIEKNYELIRDIYIQIEPFKNRRAGKLSGGMKQKLALCCALVHRPRVLFLDEPTTGVDPVSRREFWQMLRRLKDDGLSILVSTPYMDEAVLCDRIALIDNGLFLTIDTPTNIVGSFGEPLYAVEGPKVSHLLDTLRACPEIGSCYPFGDKCHVTTRDGFDLQQHLATLGQAAFSVRRIEPSVEDCFLKMLK